MLLVSSDVDAIYCVSASTAFPDATSPGRRLVITIDKYNPEIQSQSKSQRGTYTQTEWPLVWLLAVWLQARLVFLEITISIAVPPTTLQACAMAGFEVVAPSSTLSAYAEPWPDLDSYRLEWSSGVNKAACCELQMRVTDDGYSGRRDAQCRSIRERCWRE